MSLSTRANGDQYYHVGAAIYRMFRKRCVELQDDEIWVTLRKTNCINICPIINRFIDMILSRFCAIFQRIKEPGDCKTGNGGIISKAINSLLASVYIIIIIIIIIIIGIQPLGRSGQRPEFSQATGMALVRCILGKFLRVASHCFPPLFRRSHFSPPGASTSAMTWDILAAEVRTVGEECCPVILPKWRLPRHANLHGTDRRKVCWGFIRP